MLRDWDNGPDSDPKSSVAFALDLEDFDVEAPTEAASFDFFLLLFLGASGLDDESLESLLRLGFPSVNSLLSFLDDRFECFFSVFSLGGESPAPPADECLLDDFGNSGKSLDKKSDALLEVFLHAESTMDCSYQSNDDSEKFEIFILLCSSLK